MRSHRVLGQLLKVPRYYLQKARLKLIEANNNFNPKNNFLIFSDPRGGSTWLAELISLIPKTAVIWEPLNITEKNTFKKIGFGWKQYIPEDAIWNDAENAFKTVFKGKELNQTTTFFEKHNLNNYQNAQQLVVKFVNGNALLPWLTANFDLKYKPIYLIRHPFAVASSQLKHGAWQNIKKHYELPETKYNDIHIQHLDFLTSITTLEEKLVAEWCLTNLPTLRNKNNNIGWINVNYEQLVLHPEIEISRFFREWDIEIPRKILSKIQTPSITTKKGSPLTGEKQLSQWKNNLTTIQIKNMEKVMDYFEVEFYDPNKVTPSIIFS